MRIRVGCSRKINKKEKPLSKLTKKQREIVQINKIRNEKEDITINREEIQRIIKSYFENLHSIKGENLKEMDNFLDKYHLPKLNQDQITNLNTPITIKEIETVIKSPEKKPNQKKAQNQMVSAQNCTRFSKKN